jgi:DNA-binding winged helix-turn-helix (wHTH) protein
MTEEQAPATYAFGSFVLDVGRRQLLENGAEVHLSPKALLLLQMLLEVRPKAVSRAEIHDRLWPNTFVVDSNVGAIVNEVRRAIRDTAQASRFVRTVHGYGYAFHAESGDAAPQLVVARVVWNDRESPLVQGENVIGRDPQARVHADDRTVSRRHATITISGTTATLQDLGSKNGTFIAGERLSAPVELHDGTAFEVGSVKMVFRVAGEGSTQTLFAE